MERSHLWKVRGTALPSVVSYFLDEHEERGKLQEDHEGDIKAVGGVIFQGKYYSFTGLPKELLAHTRKLAGFETVWFWNTSRIQLCLFFP